METRIYRPPFPVIITKKTVFELDGCSGFLISNQGSNELTCGEPGNEIIPIASGEERQFEAPEGGIYMGNFSIKFAGTTGNKALIIKNTPTGQSDKVKRPENQENYTESKI